jgi:hypothetical protein
MSYGQTLLALVVISALFGAGVCALFLQPRQRPQRRPLPKPRRAAPAYRPPAKPQPHRRPSPPPAVQQPPAKREQSVAYAKLRRKLDAMTHDRRASDRLIEGAMLRNPERDRWWATEKVISDIERDRRS